MSEVLVFEISTDGVLQESAPQQTPNDTIVEQHPQSPVTADYSDFEFSPLATFGITTALAVAGIAYLLRKDSIKVTNSSENDQLSQKTPQ